MMMITTLLLCALSTKSSICDVNNYYRIKNNGEITIAEKSFPSSADVAHSLSSSKLQEFVNRRLHRDCHLFGSRGRCRLLQLVYTKNLVDNRRSNNAALFEDTKAPSAFDRYKDVFGHGGDRRGKRVIRKSKNVLPNYHQVFRHS